jgi:hypothetical protein
MPQPFVVQHGEQHAKHLEVRTGDEVVGRVATNRPIRDRQFAAECPVNPIVTECFPGLPVKIEPRLRLEFVVFGANEKGLGLIDVLQTPQPLDLAFDDVASPEGLAEFFAFVSRNSTCSSEILSAHQPTAARTSR